MRCVVHEKFGDPAAVLSLAERPAPEPGPGQVRLKLVLSPIHNHDLATIRGIYGYRPSLPAIPGTEALAVVEALGPGVEQPAVGQRVCVAGVPGTWAELFLARAAGLVPVPAQIPDQAACQLLAMPLSAAMLLEDLGLERGGWLIQNAAGGAVGRLVEAMARDRGLNVINLVRRESAAAQLRAAGAERVVSTDVKDWPAQVRALAGGAPITRALDSVGGRQAPSALLDILAPRGELVSFGALAGEPLVLDPGLVLFKEIVVRGFWATPRAARTPPADYQRLVREIVGMAMAGKLDLRVEGAFELGQAQEAVGAAERPGRTGKIALRG